MKNLVTSVESPIRVDWVIDTAGLRLGLTFCPGKQAAGLTGVIWKRDLDADLSELRRAGVEVLCPLLPESEMRHLGVPDLLERARESDFDVEHFPFADANIPDDMGTFSVFVDRIIAHVRSGATVVVHCRGGLGRAGLTAACVLLRLGRFQKGADAIAEVRRRRSHRAIETLAQERFVGQFAAIQHPSGASPSGA